MRLNFKPLAAFVALIILTPMVSWAYIPKEQTTLTFENVRAIKPEAGLTPQEVAKVIPTDIPAQSDARMVSKRIVDRGVQSLINGQYFDNPELARTAKKIEQALNTNISLGGTGEPGDIHHNIKLEVLAGQQAARLNYTGYVDADVIYENESKQFKVAIREPLSDTSEMKFNLESSTQTSLLSMKWDW